MLIIVKTLAFFKKLLFGTKIILSTNNRNILFQKPITKRLEH